MKKVEIEILIISNKKFFSFRNIINIKIILIPNSVSKSVFNFRFIVDVTSFRSITHMCIYIYIYI